MISRTTAIVACWLMSLFTILLLTVDFVIDSPNYVVLLKMNILFANAHLVWLFVHHAFIDPGPDDASSDIGRKLKNGHKRIFPSNRVPLDGGNRDGKTDRRAAAGECRYGLGRNGLDVDSEHDWSPVNEQQNVSDNPVVLRSGSSDGSKE